MSAETEFERLVAMLPFYVNRTLDEEGCRQVEVALAFSAELRERLEEERELAAGVICDTEAGLEGSGDRGEVRLSQMLARLPQGHSGVNSARSRLQHERGTKPDSASAFFNPRRWNLAAVLGAALLVLGGITGWQKTVIDRLEAQNDKLLPSAIKQQQAGGIVVEFSADAQWDAIAAMLDAEGLTIVSSSAIGTVTLQITAAGSDLAQQIKRLRASPLIADAHPAG